MGQAHMYLLGPNVSKKEMTLSMKLSQGPLDVKKWLFNSCSYHQLLIVRTTNVGRVRDLELS